MAQHLKSCPWDLSNLTSVSLPRGPPSVAGTSALSLCKWRAFVVLFPQPESSSHR